MHRQIAIHGLTCRWANGLFNGAAKCGLCVHPFFRSDCYPWVLLLLQVYCSSECHNMYRYATLLFATHPWLYKGKQSNCRSP